MDHELTPTYYKLKEVENLRYRTVLRRHEIYKTLWNPIYQEGSKIKIWWGTYSNSKIMFEVNKGISWNWIKPLSTEHILCTPEIDLPLLINEPLKKDALQTLKDRLSGKTKGALKNQDLCDRYHHAEKYLNKLHGIINRCNTIIARYISWKACELFRKEIKDPDTLIELTINGRSYLSQPFRGYDKILKYPEDTITHITEQEVLLDESKQPSIHGVKWRDIPHQKTPHKL